MALITGSLAACGGEETAVGADSSDPSGDGERAIAEADIIQIDGARLYALSRDGKVSIVDLSQPGRLVLEGETEVPGHPFEMYRRGPYLIVMSNRAVGFDGAQHYGPAATDPSAAALITALDVSNPAEIVSRGTLEVPGEIADSRIVGDVLYLATYENATCYMCGPEPRTIVTSLDIASPEEMRQVDQVVFQSNAPDGYNLPWGSNWKRSIFVTDQRLYIGGHADIDPAELGGEQVREGIIDVLDVSDPGGRLTPGARISVAGAILSRWQIDERDGILRVVSQHGAGRTGNGLAYPEVDTFRIDSTQSFVPLGHMVMELPTQEGLRTVRFDRDRAYAITYFQTDPLFVIDLADPRQPVQRGELYMPGFMFHLEPRGDRLIGLGIDRTDQVGSLNVSLFDVADPDAPSMIARVPFATPNIGEDYAILNGELPEDQDRIQKAFRIFADGLVVVPFTALRSFSEPSNCNNEGGGVQLVEWTDDTLVKRALLPLPGNPRRALEYRSETDARILAVSDSNVRSFSLDASGAAQQTADLVIGQCVVRDNAYGEGFGEDGGYYYDGYGCSAGGGAGTFGFLLVVVAAALARRRRG